MYKKFASLLLGVSVALLAASDLAAQTTPGPQPSICTRACWVARNGTCTSTTSLNRAIIHHTAGAEYNTTGLESSKSYVRGIQNMDMDVDGWCDIGYHFMVDKFGNIFECRKNSISGSPLGAHDSVNGGSFGFTFMGYFHPPNNNAPTTAMMNAMYALIAWKMPSGWSPYGSGSYGGDTVGKIDGHRKVKATACPGDGIHPVYITENYNGGPMRIAVANRRGGAPSTVLADFTGDGKTDMSIRRPDGTWHVLGGESGIQYGVGSDIPVPGNYLGNGATQMAVWRPSDGTWHVRGGQQGVQYGQSGDIPVPGDYNGTGQWQFAVVRAQGTDLFWHVRGGEAGIWYGQVGDIPVPGPYVGNGRWQFAIYRPSNGTWHVRGGEAGVQYGSSSDIPLPGDYVGTGRWQFAVRRPDGTWHVRGGESGIQYGVGTDIPVPGSYLGNGKAQMAVWRPSDGTWHVRGGQSVQYGATGDVPLPLPHAIKRVFFP